MSRDAITALTRFGLGLSMTSLQEAAGNPREYLLQQIHSGGAVEIDASLPPSAEVWAGHARYRRARRQAIKNGKTDEARAMRRPDFYHPEVFAHVRHAIETRSPFVERWCWFWSNHFCVSARGKQVAGEMAGGYLREAIRPKVFSSFKELLSAAISHPAMLIYLDNVSSIGPNSAIGKSRKRGLNENLAREVLELHTLGVSGGYDQDDIVNLARALTGWSVGWFKDTKPGEFTFRSRSHEPGAVTVLGKRYGETGRRQAQAILDDLSVHPSTARHLAGKLATHFVGDDAPISLVERLTRDFLATGGDLRSVARSLIETEQSWTFPPAKFLPPLDMLVSASRVLELSPSERFIRRTLRVFGQRMWSAPSPAGWPDGDDAWISPDAVLERLDWISELSGRAGKKLPAEVVRFADQLLGDSLTRETREAIAREDQSRDAISLLLLSPEMQRR